MAFTNLLDNSSTTVSAATPGAQIDLTYHATMGRTTVPVRFKVYAASTVAGDTGVVKIVAPDGTDMITVPITGSTARWYVADGELDAWDYKYDAMYGGNTSGTLTVYAFSLYELALNGNNEGTLSSSIGNFTLAATGDNTSAVFGELSQSIGSFTISATGTVRT